ncbi:MAG: alcohol dehydrogenase catalytic domain-containing protein [Actinomycetota bacterium]
MRALAIEDQNGPSSARVMQVPDPTPGPGEVVVRVHAAALNHLDLWTLSGDLGIELDFPYVLGADGAGVVVAVGDDVTGLKEGDRVAINPALACRVCEFCRAGEHSTCARFEMLGEHRDGTIAEYVKVPAVNCFPFPENLSFEQAAALGVTFITAYRMLFTRARMEPGEWILVTGIGGGLALSLFQLARPLAGRIFVTSSSDAKLERAASMGADGGVNYKDDDVGKGVRRLTAKRGVDLAADSAGGPSVDQALRALRKGGRLVIAGATAGRTAEFDVRRLFWNQLQIIGSTMGSDADVSDMLRYVAGSGIEPLIDRVYPLDEGPDAIAYLASGEQFGKIVITVA